MISNTKNIKRVITCFILSQDNRVAVFHRKDSMPSYPSHWAGISGSMEINESPLQTANRELTEETNLDIEVNEPGGLYLDAVRSAKDFGGRIIRVYPFTVLLPSTKTLELHGTEHDSFQFISIKNLGNLNNTVPGLSLAFHHATFGKYLDLPDDIKAWSEDRVSGAASLARKAVTLAQKYPHHARHIALLRPTMVPIVNAMTAISKNISGDIILQSLETETARCVQETVRRIIQSYKEKSHREKFTIATFSRSSTIFSALKQTQEEPDINLNIYCARSTPGNEGELMAKDLNATCVDDDHLISLVSQGLVDVVLVGSDCVMVETNFIINKVGTKRLAQVAKESSTPMFCCCDRWKIWDDKFPPPLENIFELVPIDNFDGLIIPPFHEKSIL